METQIPVVLDLLAEFFTAETLNARARATGFTRRQPKSGLTGQKFAQALVWGCLERLAPTLNFWAQVCLDLAVSITAQGWAERFNSASVTFMTEIFERSLTLFRQQLPLPLPCLAHFTAVNLVDSSYISLPAALATEYAGSGGDPAGLKVQLVFDFLHGHCQQVQLRPGCEPDQKYRAYLAAVTPGSLTMTDLGYFCLDSFQTIGVAKHAYWLSRYLFGTAIYTPTGERQDLLRVLQQHHENIVELDCHWGVQHHLPCRLVALRVPQEVADRRRQRAKARARRAGRRPPTATYLALLSWNIFVTNVPAAQLPAAQIRAMYRVRWQIELIFKLWKSYCGLARVAHLRRDRILTELYAKLVGAVITQFIIAPLRLPTGAAANHEISRVQVRQIFGRAVRELNRAFGQTAQCIVILENLYEHIRRFGFKQKRRQHPNVCQMLFLLTATLDIKMSSNEMLNWQVELP